MRTKGAGGLSDANGFRRILACESFKQSYSRLCEAIAKMTRTLRSQKIDPTILEPVVASRLIPLDNGESAVRPIGVGEVVRRVCGKSWRSDGRQKRMCSKQSAHSSCVRDYGLEARLQYTLCMLYLKQMPLMVYFSLMLQML